MRGIDLTSFFGSTLDHTILTFNYSKEIALHIFGNIE